MNVKETSYKLHKSEPTVRRLINQRRLTAQLVDGQYDISEEAINEYLLRHQRNVRSDHEYELLRIEQLNDQLRMSKQENEFLKKEVERLHGAVDKANTSRQRADETMISLSHHIEKIDRVRDLIDQIYRTIEIASEIEGVPNTDNNASPAPKGLIRRLMRK